MSSRSPRPSWTQLPVLAQPPPTLLDWLADRFPRVAREEWRSRFQRGLVRDAAGRPLPAEAPYVARLRVSYFREVAAEPAQGEVRVVEVGDRLVVADKPPFVPVIPGGRFVRSCLLYRLEEQLGIAGLTPVHRLDRATSGLVLFARRGEDCGAYAGLFAKGRVCRTYDALASVAERPRGRRWRVESRLATGEPFFRVAAVPGPPNARTRVDLVWWRDGVGRFRLRPLSGRKHQLRVHMASLGWAILGDRLYPALADERPDDAARPLSLVATRLVFRDPFDGLRRDLASAFDVERLTPVSRHDS